MIPLPPAVNPNFRLLGLTPGLTRGSRRKRDSSYVRTNSVIERGGDGGASRAPFYPLRASGPQAPAPTRKGRWMSNSAQEISNLVFRYAELVDFAGVGDLFRYARVTSNVSEDVREGADGMRRQLEEWTRRYSDGTPH